MDGKDDFMSVSLGGGVARGVGGDVEGGASDALCGSVNSISVVAEHTMRSSGSGSRKVSELSKNTDYRSTRGSRIVHDNSASGRPGSFTMIVIGLRTRF